MAKAMLIDEFLPRYHVRERHAVDIGAPVETVDLVLRSVDLGASPVIRSLFRLRGLPRSALTLDGLLQMGFALLGDIPQQELVFGLVGRFWTLAGDIQRIDAESFETFDRKGYAKAAWNFTLSPGTRGTTRLATETRVYCLDDGSRKRFRLYWLIIGPFSGSIRKEMLRIVKREAERAAHQA